MNDKLERMWKEVAVVGFKIISLHLCGETEEKH